MKTLAVSACLIGENCKYNGGNNKLSDELLKRLSEKYKLVPVCPEVFGGLSVPRFPCEISRGEVYNSNGDNVTDAFSTGALRALEIAKNENCGIALLKERSPSCGYGEIYDGSFSHKVITGNGICAELFEKNGIVIFGETKIGYLVE